MKDWLPVRKVLAALLATPLVVAYLAGQEGVGWREALVACLPVVAAYLVPAEAPAEQ